VKLTPGFVLRAPLPAAPKDREIYWDKSLECFGLMVTKTGKRSFVFQYRRGARTPRMSLKSSLFNDARKEAKKLVGDVARGGDPLAERRIAATAGGDTFRAIAEEYLKREGAKLRSRKQRAGILERLVYPKLGARPIGEIRKSEIVRLLDSVEDKIGAPTADMVLAFISRIMNWQAKRSDDFMSPIVRGMARSSQKERARTRTLADDELRVIWRAADASTGVFGSYVQFLLLTATRRTEASRMPSVELSGDIWTIPGSRYKTKIDHVIPLSLAAMAALDRLPKIGAAKFVFTGDGYRPFSGFSKAKAKFDGEVQAIREKDAGCEVEPLPPWTLHDLRRTARSLMSRAGVTPDIAERCLGHVLPAMRQTYDRHSYLTEKQEAFQALASQIRQIVNAQQADMR
jgi:integrase